MFHVPGVPLFQASIANFKPVERDSVNSKNPAVTEATFKIQSKHNPGVTEIERIPGRGHSLVIDNGWKEVADVAVKFVQRFT